jgi:hypothetical protein
MEINMIFMQPIYRKKNLAIFSLFLVFSLSGMDTSVSPLIKTNKSLSQKTRAEQSGEKFRAIKSAAISTLANIITTSPNSDVIIAQSAIQALSYQKRLCSFVTELLRWGTVTDEVLYNSRTSKARRLSVASIRTLEAVQLEFHQF